jgi:hypothetical protein
VSPSTWGLIGSLIIMGVLGPAMARAYRRSTKRVEKGRVIVRYTRWYIVFALAGLVSTVFPMVAAYVGRSSVALLVVCAAMALVLGSYIRFCS